MKKDTKEEPKPQAPLSGKKFFITLVVLVLLVFGTISWFNRDLSENYNGFIFEEVQCTGKLRCWETMVQAKQGTLHPILFYNPPWELESTLVDARAILAIRNLVDNPNGKITIAFTDGASGEVGVAAAQIARITGERLLGVATTGAVYGQDVTCQDATLDHIVIHIQEAGELTSVQFVDGCVGIIASSSEELRPLVDAFVYQLLGIQDLAIDT